MQYKGRNMFPKMLSSWGQNASLNGMFGIENGMFGIEK
jgi:hypothetical protein